MRTPYITSDRAHSTLQKAVKDGNVLEKIKAFEMQAAAAQAESTTKLGTLGINNRMQSITPSVQPVAYRAFSPPIMHSIQQPISHASIQHESQQQYIRSRRSRYVYPAPNHHDNKFNVTVGHESKKTAHVLEPACGDVILKRRTPSQKTVNDEDYSVTVNSSMIHAIPSNYDHRQRHHHQRTSVSRSRHRKETVHDKYTSNHHENVHKKHHKQQQKEVTMTPSSSKISTSRRWLKGHKETSNETVIATAKQDVSSNKSKKHNKNKKKTVEQEKYESKTKIKTPASIETMSSDNNCVYGVPNTTTNEQTKIETMPAQPPSRIEEENESNQEENIINKNIDLSSKDDIIREKSDNTTITTNIERQANKTQSHLNLSNIDKETLSKVKDEIPFV